MLSVKVCGTDGAIQQWGRMLRGCLWRYIPLLALSVSLYLALRNTNGTGGSSHGGGVISWLQGSIMESTSLCKACGHACMTSVLSEAASNDLWHATATTECPSRAPLSPARLGLKPCC